MTSDVPVRIQRRRTRGWRMPPGAVYVGRPTIFGNPWSMQDAAGYEVPVERRRAWLVAKYREELEHGGLMSDWSAVVSEKRWDEMDALFERLAPFEYDDLGGIKVRSIKPLFRYLLRDATALACWCPLSEPCHADVLIELLEGA